MFDRVVNASGLRKLFCHGSKRNTLEYSLQTYISPFFWSHIWKYKIQPNERLTKIKEKWSTIQLHVCDLSFMFFIPMSQTIVIKRSGTCYFLHTSTSGAYAGLCTYNHTHQMEKTDFTYHTLMTFLIMLSVILLPMLIILFSILNVIWHLICGNN